MVGAAAGVGVTCAGTAGAAGGGDVASIVARHAGRRPVAWGMFLPGGIVTGFQPRGREVALTFDACGGGGAGSEANVPLLQMLTSLQVPATLFLNSRWIDANPRWTETLIANPLFEIGNHGTRHCPLSVTGRSAYGIAGTRSAQEVVDEVSVNHEKLTRLLGHPPRWFRTGTAHYDDVAVSIVKDLGEVPLGFAINGDLGATASAGEIHARLATAVPGDISIGHMNQPGSRSAHGFTMAVADLRAKGFTFVTLGDRATRTDPPQHSI